jgi:hypothetical protein
MELLKYIVWTQMSRLLPEDGDRIQSPKHCFKLQQKKKKKVDGWCPKHNNCIMNTASERETDPGETEDPHENQILGRNSTSLAL